MAQGVALQNFAKSLWRHRRSLCAAHRSAPILTQSLAEESVSVTRSQKPVVVFDGRAWRRYHWDRQLLGQSVLGDVIPELTNSSANESAAAHIFARSDAPADIVSPEAPSSEVWQELLRVWSSIENEHAPRLDEICCAAIEWQSGK
jgi:hypothetical protein